jgi:hypothetical protein
MKIQRKRNSCHVVRRKAARLNKIVLVVALLWLVTSALVLFFYQPGNTRAVEPGDSRQQLALLAPDAA